MTKINANNVKEILIDLAEKFRIIGQTKVSNRILELYSWIKTKKTGQLINKKFVMDFLTELIEDLNLYWKLENFSSEKYETAISFLSPLEQYWYINLFPSLCATYHRQ